MEITIISVGKIKEKFILEGINEYIKRLKAFSKINIIELPDEKIPDKASNLQIEQIKEKEGLKIFKKIPSKSFVIALDILGVQKNSEDFANFIDSKMTDGHSNIVFIIGGSLGLWENILQHANYRLSFSKMTFPHQLMKLILVEQIYRSFKIIRGGLYHK